MSEDPSPPPTRPFALERPTGAEDPEPGQPLAAAGRPGGGPGASHRFTRRRFVATAAGVAGAGVATYAATQQPWRKVWPATAARPQASNGGRAILVLVTLYGGNDGLNTVIPMADSAYLSSRPTLGHQPGAVQTLAEGLGLHPNLKGLKALWDAKRLAIVRGVGYPNPVLSHFRSMDIWQSGSPETAVSTGILGRWLDATGADPMRAISVGPALPMLLTGEKSAGTAIAARGLTIPGGSRLTPLLTSLDAPGRDRGGLRARVASSGSDLLRVRHTVADLLGRAPVPAATGSSNLETAPPGETMGPGAAASRSVGRGTNQAAGASPRPTGGLTGQLDLVAQLIRAGSPTKVYQVSMGGFDNHAQEKDAHDRLMAELDTAVSRFFAALSTSTARHGVVLMTYSEFGRRVSQNASGGTDHGTAAPLFVAGPSVRGGRFYGEEPSLTDLADGNLKFSTDFRSVFATVLAKVLGVDPKVSLGSVFPILDFV